MRRIREPAPAEDLLGTNREESLQRHEDEEEHQQSSEELGEVEELLHGHCGEKTRRSAFGYSPFGCCMIGPRRAFYFHSHETISPHPFAHTRLRHPPLCRRLAHLPRRR